jgi:hypothetical protein
VVVAGGFLILRILNAGFGADNDTYLMLGTWDQLTDYGTYSPSRYQGSPLAEVSIGSLADVGGHRLSGAMSVALAILALLSLNDLIKRRITKSSDRWLLVSILAMTPMFIIAGSTSHDYMYGLALFLAAWAGQERGIAPHYVAMILVLATWGRLSYLPLALVVLLVGQTGRGNRQRATCIALYLPLVVVGYLPAYFSAGSSLDFLSADRPTGQGLVGLLARALFKPTMMLGILGSLAFLAVVVLALTAKPSSSTGALGEKWLLVLLGICLVTWTWVPVEPSYLLPALAITLVWLARPAVLDRTRSVMVVLLIALVSLAWIEPQLVRFSYAQYDQECAIDEAVAASIDVDLHSGQLLGYPKLVERNLPCNESFRAAKGQPPP